MEEVKNHEGPEITDMGVIVDGRAAAVDPDFAGLSGLKLLQPPGERVVEAEWHGFDAVGQRAKET